MAVPARFRVRRQSNQIAYDGSGEHSPFSTSCAYRRAERFDHRSDEQRYQRCLQGNCRKTASLEQRLTDEDVVLHKVDLNAPLMSATPTLHRQKAARKRAAMRLQQQSAHI
jgi:hypothetical protein